MAKGNPKIPEYVYDVDVSLLSNKFAMLVPELFESKSFQNLTIAARLLYIILCVHKASDMQRACLKNALEDYNRIFDLGMSEGQILDEAMPSKRTKYTSNYFVFTTKHMEAYGLKKNYVTKLMKELKEKGFIKVAYGGKGRYGGWNTNVTVYQFSNEWKK